MNRVPRGAVIPFTVLGCNGVEWETSESVFKSLPLIENYNSGELCPGLAVPYEDVYDQVTIISVGIPRVAKASVSSWNSPWQRILFEKPLQNLSCQESGVVLRAHYATDSSYSAWIQAGFSALERHATELIPFRNDSLDYTTLKKVATPCGNPFHHQVLLGRKRHGNGGSRKLFEGTFKRERVRLGLF